ncbi:hypothetical protein GGR56DRAFT_496306 [Xylariaceae sp. FL0804]|nr:hypothetical protein GGR56DRAFT_496306 [Xylariaceae sp. FL0804]
MVWTSLFAFAAAALVPQAGAQSSPFSLATTLRFSCSQLVVERLDPVVNPGMNPSPHLHQVVGGNAFNASMGEDLPAVANCTTCTPTEDFSNYWTAVLFFRARNGTFHRVNTFGNGLGFSEANGGQTVYYLSYGDGNVTAFKPGFRMTVGNPDFRTAAQLNAAYMYLQYTCLQTDMTRTNVTLDFPATPCPAGIMATVRFPTCWDGVNLDSPDHQSHMAYPITNSSSDSSSGGAGGSCPASHPVAVPQVFYETYWDTRPFNDMAEWPTTSTTTTDDATDDAATQPFVWSFGDATGYGIHGDYVFGWEGDALQRAMDARCDSDLFTGDLNCPTLAQQTIEQANGCALPPVVDEEIDGWLAELPGGMPVTD